MACVSGDAQAFDHVTLCHAGQAPQRSKRLVEAAVAALRSRDAAKQLKAIDAILRDAHARVPRAHWAAEWTAAQALPARSPPWHGSLVADA